MFDSFILPAVPWPVFWVFVALAIVIQGISKSGFAGGAGVLSLPLMMLVMPVDKVAATLLPLLILCDFNAIYHHRRNQAWPVVWEVFVPACAGIVLGALVWWWIGQEGVARHGVHIKRFVGVIAILFAAYILGRETAQSWFARLEPAPRMAWPMGIAAGFCSTIAHAAGPIVGLYVFSKGLGKTLFVGTFAWIFTLINLAKLPFYVAVGLIDTSVLAFGAVLIPFIPIGSALGRWMHYRVSEPLFNRIIFVLIVIAAIQLLFDVNLVQQGLELIFRGRAQSN